jgi:hypothetical protein
MGPAPFLSNNLAWGEGTSNADLAGRGRGAERLGCELTAELPNRRADHEKEEE